MTTTIVLTVAGVYLVTIAQLMKTKNVRSGIVFKVTPMLIGIACLVLAAKAVGLI